MTMQQRVGILMVCGVMILSNLTGALIYAQASAEDGQPGTRIDHQQRFLETYARKDWVSGEKILREWIAADPENFVPYYNLACNLGRQGGEKLSEAERMLRSAIEHGFADRVRLVSDPDLEPLRATATYRAITESWNELIDAQVESRLESARNIYKKGYVYERDENHRLWYISAFDAEEFKAAKEEIGRLVGWWEREVLPSAASGGSEGKDAQSYVMVILPTRADFRRWAVGAYAGAADRIGGEYSHDDRRLIAMDLGSTLRHEFWHVLHWRDMERLGQRHAAWVMEGLCSLVEDVETTADGSFKPMASWRTNMIKRGAKFGTLMPLEKYFSMDQSKFVGNRPLAQYAQGRALLMWVYRQGKLREWYGAYTAGFREDPTGKLALERVLGKPIKEIEKEFKKWLVSDELETVVTEIVSGMANLPSDVDAGDGDGVVVVESRHREIRARDVVTAIDGKPIRDLYDYARVLSRYQPGARVVVGVRRRGERMLVEVELVRQP